MFSLSTTPLSSFSTWNWSSLVNLIMSLLTNPYFYWFIAVIVIMSILPTFDDD